jgi:hypothetical protein
MKKSALKTVIVKCLNWEETIVVDSDVFEDYYMEAATRAIEKKKEEDNIEVAVVMECYEKKNEKKPNKHFVYNTYYVLVNAALYDKAELLRLNFMKLHGIDLKEESLKGDSDINGNGQ